MYFYVTSSAVAQANSLAESGEYEQAFQAFKEIEKQNPQDPKLRAYCIARMGDLIVPCPWLTEYDDESGLEYFKRAIAITEECGPAWVGVLSSYDELPPGHQDIDLVKEARKRLASVDRESIPDWTQMIIDGFDKRNPHLAH